MAMHTFTIEGQTFVAGLFWQPLAAGNNAERSKEVKSLAKELNFDLYIVRGTSAYCVGYGSGAKGIKAGTLSAAAVISKSIEEEHSVRDFIFTSQLPDGNWIYLSQRDGIILPDGDEIYASEDAARAKLLQDSSLGDWPFIVAPAMWGIANSQEGDFVSLIPRKANGKIKVHKWWRLLPISSGAAVSANAGKILMACIIAAVAFGGFKFYKDWKQQKMMEEAARAAALQIDAQGKIQPPEHPWKNQPLASEMLSACLSALAQVRLFPGNWDLTAVNCSNNALTVAWQPRKGGWIEHLKIVEPNIVVALDGSAASLTLPLPALQTGIDEQVSSQNDRLTAMYSAAQRYGVSFTATPPAPAPQPLPGQDPNVIPKDWAEIGWRVESVDLPHVVLTALEGNGFRMSAINGAWRNGKFNWMMEGTQYVQP